MIGKVKHLVPKELRGVWESRRDDVSQAIVKKRRQGPPSQSACIWVRVGHFLPVHPCISSLSDGRKNKIRVECEAKPLFIGFRDNGSRLPFVKSEQEKEL